MLIDSEDKRFAGSGTPRPLAPYQAILYEVGRSARADARTALQSVGAG